MDRAMINKEFKPGNELVLTTKALNGEFLWHFEVKDYGERKIADNTIFIARRSLEDFQAKVGAIVLALKAKGHISLDQFPPEGIARADSNMIRSLLEGAIKGDERSRE